MCSEHIPTAGKCHNSLAGAAAAAALRGGRPRCSVELQEGQGGQ